MRFTTRSVRLLCAGCGEVYQLGADAVVEPGAEGPPRVERVPPVACGHGSTANAYHELA